jgi:hypothetical protein
MLEVLNRTVPLEKITYTLGFHLAVNDPVRFWVRKVVLNVTPPEE